MSNRGYYHVQYLKYCDVDYEIHDENEHGPYLTHNGVDVNYQIVLATGKNVPTL